MTSDRAGEAYPSDILSIGYKQPPVTRVTACYKWPVTDLRHKPKNFILMNQALTRERERYRYIILFIVTVLQGFGSEKSPSGVWHTTTTHLSICYGS